MNSTNSFHIPAQETNGTTRARARLTAKRKANESIPKTVTLSRQAKRLAERVLAKQKRKHENEEVKGANKRRTNSGMMPGNRALRRKLMSRRCPPAMKAEAMAGIKAGLEESVLR